jgi:cytochrome c oxidase cbb3-type subunit 2
MNPRDVVPESNMPAYPWLARTRLDPAEAAPKLRTLRTLGVPYTDAEIAGAAQTLKDKTEMDAVIAYLQGLGIVLRDKR